jgi:hypothetical protein
MSSKQRAISVDGRKPSHVAFDEVKSTISHYSVILDRPSSSGSRNFATNHNGMLCGGLARLAGRTEVLENDTIPPTLSIHSRAPKSRNPHRAAGRSSTGLQNTRCHGILGKTLPSGGSISYTGVVFWISKLNDYASSGICYRCLQYKRLGPAKAPFALLERQQR